jgi:hypothetical protein
MRDQTACTPRGLRTITSFNGDSGADNLYAREDSTGNLLNGGTEDDHLFVQDNASSSSLNGDEGSDSLYAEGTSHDNELNGDSGSDNLYAREDSTGNLLNGGTEDDHLFVQDNASSSSLNGDSGADNLYAREDSTGNLLNGGTEDDHLFVQDNASSNSLNGDEGSDSLYAEGTSHDNELHGGVDNDVLSILDDAHDNLLHGNEGNDDLQGGAQPDHLFGDEGNDLMTGGGGDDTLEGGSGEDILWGGSGEDTLWGGLADLDPVASGDDGADILHGGEGDDFLDGGLQGKDSMFGGEGNDLIFADWGLDDPDGGSGKNAIHWRGRPEQIWVNFDWSNDSLNVWVYADLDTLFLTVGATVNLVEVSSPVPDGEIWNLVLVQSQGEQSCIESIFPMHGEGQGEKGGGMPVPFQRQPEVTELWVGLEEFFTKHAGYFEEEPLNLRLIFNAPDVHVYELITNLVASTDPQIRNHAESLIELDESSEHLANGKAHVFNLDEIGFADILESEPTNQGSTGPSGDSQCPESAMSRVFDLSKTSFIDAFPS